MHERDYRPRTPRQRVTRIAGSLILLAGAGFGIAYVADVLAEKTHGKTGVIEPVATPAPSAAAGTPDSEEARKKAYEEYLKNFYASKIEGTIPAGVPVQQTENQFIFQHIEPNQTWLVEAGSVVVGDVFVNDIREFDNNAKTGLVVVAKKQLRIKAPYGADVRIPKDNASTTDLAQQAVKEMQVTGCVQGCTDGVKVLVK